VGFNYNYRKLRRFGKQRAALQGVHVSAEQPAAADTANASPKTPTPCSSAKNSSQL